ncbi:MAG: hypothetical protein EP330_25790 [Deltaproteobacteria bacterium]|nr:MAG: hypothetical protein EP330_25790 [Deltaproteobacteria bacterium]
MRTVLLLALLGCNGPTEETAVDSGTDSSDSGDTDTGGSDTGDTAPATTATWTDGVYTATVTVDDPDAELRTYTLTSDHPRRDNLPSSGLVTIVEQAGQMRLRSASLVLDALFALAIQEVRDNSVSQIQDFAFAQPEPCNCFETGEKWTWVWTRDTGYAVEHALAMVDPERSRNSLQFKLSDHKAVVGGGTPTIVQDTGSGGSWPVSTDRAVWSLGAWETLKFLDGADRTAFRDQAYTAMVNTLEEDRIYVFDDQDGLYRGEQSFLDWREQSYPSWTASDTVHIAMSKSLSTNMAHLRMMQITAALATEKGETAAADRYGQWATELAAAIDRELWVDGDGLYSAMKTTGLDPAPIRKWDLLGESMAALWLADASRASTMVAAYPHAPGGPPVLFPQQPFTPIYHNRGVWPFVTAYDLRAARRAENAAVFTADAMSLVRGSALNLSNMENFEFLTGDNWVSDGKYSGPVVNSRRQLWSVAGFVALVTRGLYGIEASQTGLSVAPFVPAELYRDLVGGGELTLHDVPWRGATLDITLVPPSDTSGAGAFAVTSATLDGSAVSGELQPAAGAHDLRIQLGAASTVAGSMRAVTGTDFREVYAPVEPSITSLSESGGRLVLAFDGQGEQQITFNVFRDGVEVASGLTQTSWTDPASDPGVSHCYAVESEFASGNVSHHSPPMCWWGASYERITTLDHGAFTVNGGNLVTAYGRTFYENWGARDHTLSVSFTPPNPGDYLVQVTYGNGAGPVNTGVTVGHKRLRVYEGASEVDGGFLVMPHLGDWNGWEDSNFVPVRFDSTNAHTLVLEVAPNMSWLQHHQPYNYTGGGNDTFDFVNVAEVKLLRLTQ